MGLLILKVAWKYTSQRTERNLTRGGDPPPFFFLHLELLIVGLQVFSARPSGLVTQLGVGLFTSPCTQVEVEKALGCGLTPGAISLYSHPLFTAP